MKRIIMTTACLMLLIPALTWAQGNLGQSGGNFLQIPVDPRGAALSGAVVAVSEGAPALYWNPAGAVHTENVDVYFSQTQWFVDTNLLYGGVTKNLGTNGVVGLSLTSFYMDEMEITTVYESEGTGEYFDAGNLAVGLSYARQLTDRFTFGLTGKYIQENIWDESADQVALDVGSLYQTDFMNLQLGMVIRNFAGKLKMSGDNVDGRMNELEGIGQENPNDPRIERLTPEYRLPQVFQIGMAFTPVDLGATSHLQVLTDVDVPSDNEERISVGMEYGYNQMVYLRGSFRINDDTSEFALGAGFNLNLGAVGTRVDYSFSAYDVMDDVHRVGLGFSL